MNDRKLGTSVRYDFYHRHNITSALGICIVRFNLFNFNHTPIKWFGENPTEGATMTQHR